MCKTTVLSGCQVEDQPQRGQRCQTTSDPNSMETCLHQAEPQYQPVASCQYGNRPSLRHCGPPLLDSGMQVPLVLLELLQPERAVWRNLRHRVLAACGANS